MTEPSIDDAMLIAWIDGELGAEEAGRVAAAVSGDPALTARAEAQRRLQARFRQAFDPIAREPVRLPVTEDANVVSLEAARAERRPAWRRWSLPAGALAAGLALGLVAAGQLDRGIEDRPGMLAVTGPLADALESQLSGEAGPVRITLSFRDQAGDFCRSFSGRNVSGVACRGADAWQLRYAGPGSGAETDYRMAGDDQAAARFVQATITGDPLDAEGERAARQAGWRTSSR